MNRLPLLAILFVLMGLGLSNCNYQPPLAVAPLAVEQYFATLPAMDQPVKVVVDSASRRIYWLSFTGEIYRVHPDGSKPERIIGGVGANQPALFIQDFCVDSSNERIVFTDLRDLRTGRSAIKQANLSGTLVSTLVLLPDEIPYQVGVNPHTDQVYYLTAGSQKVPQMYRLRTLDQEGALLISPTKIQPFQTWSGDENELLDNKSSEKILAKR
ncbi:MAG: hypothetical protein WA960_22960 [Tunicatimonas sp.]